MKHCCPVFRRKFLSVVALFGLLASPNQSLGELKTYDGRHSIADIDVTVVYFVPRDRVPLPDWRNRVDYYCRRLELFHQRELEGQSTLSTTVVEAPLISESDTADLRAGNANAIFFRTLKECDRRLEFANDNAEERSAFPILLVLSEINWRPLDDFYRLHPDAETGNLVFEGNYRDGQHFPGATSGGARATYLADRGVGWGLVSADGWRVPYRGSDCVVYHEGCGHTIGLPHPDPINRTVMGTGQYHGWISESSLDKEQRIRLGWEPSGKKPSSDVALFSQFRAIPEPSVPSPGEAISLKLDWPEGTTAKKLDVRIQTDVRGPWIQIPQTWQGSVPATASLGQFDRETPVSYRIDAKTADGATVELWGYLQVRSDPQRHVPAPHVSEDLAQRGDTEVRLSESGEISLLDLVDIEDCWQKGKWQKTPAWLQSPKEFGARIEVPFEPDGDYRLTAVVEPLDVPNGFLIGNAVGGSRFMTLFNYATDSGPLSAIENIDGKNVGNETTFRGAVFQTGKPSRIEIEVTDEGIRGSVDGAVIYSWRGSPDRLSLGEYWKTPDSKKLIIGAYDCRYRIYRLTISRLASEAK